MKKRLLSIILCVIQALAITGAWGSEIKFKLVNLSESVFTDRFPSKAILPQPVATPRNAKFGIIAALMSDEPETITLNAGEFRSVNNRIFPGKITLKNLIPVHVEGNTQGPLKNYPGGKVRDSWKPLFTRMAPFDVLEAVDDVPHDSVTLAADKVAGVMVEFSVPANTVPGVYKGRITVSGKSGKQALPFSFRVYPTALPGNYGLNSMHWLWPEPENLQRGRTVKWWSEDHWKLLENTGRTMLDSGDDTLFTPLIFGKEPLIRTTVDSNGKYSFDMTGFERWMWTFSKMGFKAFAGHHLHSWMLPLYVFDAKTGARRQVALDVPEGNKPGLERCKVYDAFLPVLYASLKKLKMTDVYMQQVLDEPRPEQLETYRIYADMCHKYLPGIKTIDASCRLSAKDFYPLIDITVLHLPVLYNQLRVKKLKPGAWLYSATGPWPPLPNRHLDRPLVENRLWPLLAARFGLNGYMNWAANIYRGVPDEYAASIGPLPDGSQNPGHPPGDAWFFYRGPNGLRTGLRMLNFRDGMVDATLVQMLQKKRPGAVKKLLDAVIYPDFMDIYKLNKHSLELAKFSGRRYSIRLEQYNSLRERVLQDLQ